MLRNSVVRIADRPDIPQLFTMDVMNTPINHSFSLLYKSEVGGGLNNMGMLAGRKINNWCIILAKSMKFCLDSLTEHSDTA